MDGDRKPLSLNNPVLMWFGFWIRPNSVVQDTSKDLTLSAQIIQKLPTSNLILGIAEPDSLEWLEDRRMPRFPMDWNCLLPRGLPGLESASWS